VGDRTISQHWADTVFLVSSEFIRSKMLPWFAHFASLTLSIRPSSACSRLGAAAAVSDALQTHNKRFSNTPTPTHLPRSLAGTVQLLPVRSCKHRRKHL